MTFRAYFVSKYVGFLSDGHINSNQLYFSCLYNFKQYEK